jgi:hypothetical protein
MHRYPLLMYISVFSSVLPIGIGLLRKKFLDLGMNILFIYLIFAFTADIFLTWFVRGYQLTLGLFHLYFLVEYIFIISIISFWQESYQTKKRIQVVMSFYILFWIIAKFTFEPLSGLYTFTASTSMVLLTLSAGYTLFIVIGNRMQKLSTDYRFWVLLSFVVYYAGTIMVIALRGILIHQTIEILFLVNSIDWSLKILFNIIFVIAFLCPQTRT